MDSVMIAARKAPERLEETLRECGLLRDTPLLHIPDTTRAIHQIKTKPSDLVIVSTGCPGAESYFNVLHAAGKKKGDIIVVLAIANRNADMKFERDLSRSMGAHAVVQLHSLVDELPAALGQVEQERAAS